MGLRDKSASISDLLLETLRAEKEVFSAFIDLLEREQLTLKAGAPIELPALTSEKNSFAERLGDLATKRNTLLSATGLNGDRSGIDSFCAQHTKTEEIANTWSAILCLAAKAKETNQMNGQLISLRAHYNSQILDALQGNPPHQSLYGPNGQSSLTSSTRRVNDSV